jgi:hypothetical protein
MRKETAAHSTVPIGASSAGFNPRRMALEITPEPSEEERKAILKALDLEANENASPSPWQAAGLGPEEGQAGAPPRQSRGATRA